MKIPEPSIAQQAQIKNVNLRQVIDNAVASSRKIAEASIFELFGFADKRAEEGALSLSLAVFERYLTGAPPLSVHERHYEIFDKKIPNKIRSNPDFMDVGTKYIEEKTKSFLVI